jgi:hypothetical protein
VRIRDLLPLAMLSVVACGSRTGLVAEPAGSADATVDASQPDVVDGGAPDVPIDMGSPDVPIDMGPPDSPPTPCTSNAQCDNGIACDVNTCDLDAGTCTHTPDNSLCPPGFACEPPCVAASFAESPSDLYGVNLPAGSVMNIGATSGDELDDIALAPDGTLYGVGGPGLYTVDTKTGAAKFVVSVDEIFNALDFAPDGTLYGALEGGGEVYTIDPKTGDTTQVATYPAGYESSGDLAVIGNQLLATVTSGGTGNDVLVSIDLTTFEASVIGTTGYRQIYGLAAYGTQLFGYTDSGLVIQIDPTTAKTTLLAKTGITFYGASAR